MGNALSSTADRNGCTTWIWRTVSPASLREVAQAFRSSLEFELPNSMRSFRRSLKDSSPNTPIHPKTIQRLVPFFQLKSYAPITTALFNFHQEQTLELVAKGVRSFVSNCSKIGVYHHKNGNRHQSSEEFSEAPGNLSQPANKMSIRWVSPLKQVIW
jgi:hypothetical protein